MTRPDSQDARHSQPLANLYGMVICSNSASHLWPLSRERTPLELVCDPSSGLSPLARTIQAIHPYCERPLIIAVPRDIALYVKQHIANHSLLKPEEYQLLIEPHPRGTALTTALAAAMVKLKDPHALLLCLPAVITFDSDDRWEQTLRRAHRVAASDRIALVGSSVPPLIRAVNGHSWTHGGQSWTFSGQPINSGHSEGGGRRHRDFSTPTLLGTIRMGLESPEIEGAYQVRSFIARPAPAVAWRAQQNKSLWSTHIFMLRASLVLAELRTAGREASDPLMQSVQRVAETARFFVALGSEHWGSKEAAALVETLPTFSFEEAVFETTKLLMAVPTSIPFADFATFAGYEQTLEADAKGNRLRGHTLAVQTRNSTVLSDGGKLVVTLGLEDALVVDTADATLVTTRDALAAMPSVMAALRAANAPEL
jgi:mannose-1-phosphate guanylyltransferase